MKVTRYIYFCLLAILLSGCGNNKNDRENMGLSGNVKQIIELQFIAQMKFGKPEKGDLYREDGWDLIYLFNDKGFFEKITQLNQISDEVGHSEYKYNDKKQLTAEVSFDAEGGLSDKVVYTYDKNNRPTQAIAFNNTDNITGSTLYEYKNDTIVASSYNARGNLKTKVVQKVNKDGFPVETKIYGEDNVMVNHRKERHDKEGRLETLIVLHPENGATVMNVRLKYDKQGNIIKKEGTDENGEDFLPTRYEYTFDNTGNWVSKIEYIGDKPTFITERQIEYYK